MPPSAPAAPRLPAVPRPPLARSIPLLPKLAVGSLNPPRLPVGRYPPDRPVTPPPNGAAVRSSGTPAPPLPGVPRPASANPPTGSTPGRIANGTTDPSGISATLRPVAGSRVRYGMPAIYNPPRRGPPTGVMALAAGPPSGGRPPLRPTPMPISGRELPGRAGVGGAGRLAAPGTPPFGPPGGGGVAIPRPPPVPVAAPAPPGGAAVPEAMA